VQQHNHAASIPSPEYKAAPIPLYKQIQTAAALALKSHLQQVSVGCPDQKEEDI